MATHSRKPPGHIHKIREFELEKITLSDEFDILQIVGEGWFGKILLVEHRATDTEMVLKALPKPYVSVRDFYREFHYGLHLGLHRNIVTTYDVAFETAGFFVFTQEYAPLGDLTSNVADSGIGELHSKKVAKQIASALDYMHSKGIVHRDVKLDNVLIYKSDFSRVKLCDFGESYKTGSIVERRNEWLPYSPPEVLQIQPEGTYEALPNHDVWQFGIVIFVCLTGCLPWQKASVDDPRYARYLAWQNINMMIPLRRTPKLFKLLTSKASRMFRKFLEPKPDRRPKNLIDLNRFLDDRWLAKSSEKDMAEFEPDELCPSMYSFHSSAEEKNRVLWSLAEQGIETTVDRREKKIRIKNWIESSVIMEDDEEEDSGSASASPSSSISREPVPGHISSIRAENQAEKARQKTINTTIKDASQKHFDPRTGVVQQGPSEMGTIYRNQSLSNISNSTATGHSLNSSLLTLGSRNNLIMSEGNPYQSDFNIMENNIIDDESLNIHQQQQQQQQQQHQQNQQQQQKMVNEHLKNITSSNNFNSNIKNSNNKYNYSNIASNTTTATTSIFSIANNNGSTINNNYNLNNSSNSNNNFLLSKTNIYHTLSDPNLTDTQDIDNSNNLTNQKYYRNNYNNINDNNQISRTGKPLQRTKSDSLRKVVHFMNDNLITTTAPKNPKSTIMTVDIDIDSSYDTNNSSNSNKIKQQKLQQLHQQQQYFTASAIANNNNQINSKINNSNNNSNNNNNNISNNSIYANINNYNKDNSNVSKYGLLSAFKSIATISVPEYNQENSNNNTEESQFQQNTKNKTKKYTKLINNNHNKNTQQNNNIKDNQNGYGSYNNNNDQVNFSNSNQNLNNGNYSINKDQNIIINEQTSLKTNINNKNNNNNQNENPYQMIKYPENYSNNSNNSKQTAITKQVTAKTTTQTTQTQYGARRKNYNEIFPPSSTMKDTPYDRVKMINSNNNNNNSNAKK